MHELAITQALVDLVVERTPGRQVASVRVRVGRLSGVVPDAMEFAFDIVTAETPIVGATLVIEEVPGRITCRSCGRESDLDDQVLLCDCGSADVRVVSGDELVVVSVELVREAASCA